MAKPSFGKLHPRAAHFGASGKGVPYISDGDSARVLFFFNLSGAYNGNERLEEAKADARIIAHRANTQPELLSALECELALDAPYDLGQAIFKRHGYVKTEGKTAMQWVRDKSRTAIAEAKEGI